MPFRSVEDVMKAMESMFSSRNIAASPVLMRLMLCAGEVYRLPQAGEQLRVVSGQAWLTAQGRDVVLSAGDEVILPASVEAALISPIDHTALVLEVLAA
jgi:hypothetical protein